MNKYLQTMQIIRSVRDKTDTCVLFYSAGGKDGIALLDMLANTFKKVICYYMYLIPDLDHVKPYIRWAQTHYRNVEVRQIQHYQMAHFQRSGLFMDEHPEVKPKKVGEVEQEVLQTAGLKFAFNGMKGVDGYMKRMRLMKFAKNGYVTDKGMVYPLALWTNKEVLKYIEKKKLIKPFVYKTHEKEASQGFGIDLGTMLMMRDRYPNDYKRILEYFPYSAKLIYDYERKQDKTN